MSTFLAKLQDGYQNLAARLGLKTNNLTKAGNYEWDGLVNERMTLEYMYSGSWVAKAAIEVPAQDMTRVGVTLTGIEQQEAAIIQKAVRDLDIWNSLRECIMWARLYGGCIGYMRISGQDPTTPLDMNTVDIDQFEGIEVLSRWQVTPQLGDPIIGGVDHGLPKYYTSVFDNTMYAKPFTIHHSRVIRFIGITVPWYQKIALLFWGQSVLVNIHSRIKAYDMINTMIDQISNKAHLRTLKIKGMREVLATGGEDAESMLLNYVQLMRETQSTEDITLIDGDDIFEAIPYNFAGLKELMEIEGEQLSGALGIPQSKLFGRQADGLGATHTGDISYYYANIECERENRLRRPLNKILALISRSKLGKPLPEDFDFIFDSLEQLDDATIADLGTKTTNSVAAALDKNIITVNEAREQLRKSSKITKLFGELEGDIAEPEVTEGEPKSDDE